jgi:hypothetical protein
MVKRLKLARTLAEEAEEADAALAVMRGVVEKFITNIFLDALLLMEEPPGGPSGKTPQWCPFERAYALGIWGFCEPVNLQGFRDSRYRRLALRRADGEVELQLRQLAERIRPRFLDILGEELGVSLAEAEEKETTREVDLLMKLISETLANVGVKPPKEEQELYSIRNGRFVWDFLADFSLWTCEEHEKEAQKELYGEMKGRVGEELLRTLGVRAEDLADASLLETRGDEIHACFKCGRPANIIYVNKVPAPNLIVKVLDENLDDDVKEAIARALGYEGSEQRRKPFETFYRDTYNRLNAFAHPDIASFLPEGAEPRLQGLWREVSGKFTSLLLIWVRAIKNTMSEICEDGPSGASSAEGQGHDANV